MSKPFVILDQIHNQLESAKSGIIPGSYTQAIVAGVQNVPSSIKQLKMSSASGTCYTTFPLSPLARNCNDLTEAFIRLKFNIRFKLTLNPGLAAGQSLPLYVGFRDTANIISMLHLLIENNNFHSATYFRQESVLTYNSISDAIKESDPQYATINKLIKHIKCPMKHIILKGADGPKTDFDLELPFNITIDVSRLCPLISNLHYTTYHFGNLKIKLFFQDIAQALFIAPDLDYGFDSINDFDSATPSTLKISHLDNKDFHKYYTFYPFNYIAQNYSTGFDQAPFYSITYPLPADLTGKHDNLIIKQSIKISDHSSKAFFEMEEADMVQSNFDISEAEYKSLESLFASNGSIVIPSQTYSTNVFNNSDISAGDDVNTSMVGNIGAYNIDHVSIYFTPQNQSTYFMKVFPNSTQCLIDGRPINAIPYEFIDDRFIKDSVACLFNDDEDATSHDYLASLNFLNLTGTKEYTDSDMYAIPELSKPNLLYPMLEFPATFAMNFKTNTLSAFHSGACILENSNRQANLRFTNGDMAKCDANDKIKAEAFPWHIIPKSNKVSTNCFFSCLCDCCLVFAFDPDRNTCFEAAVSWVSPFE